MLVMDTRCRAAPLRPAVRDGMRRYASKAAGKENHPAVLPSSPKKTYALGSPASSTTHRVPGRASTGKGSGASATSSARPDNSVAESRMARAESNGSRSSTPVTESPSWCPSSTSSFATSVFPDVDNGCPKDDNLDGHRSNIRSRSTSGDMNRLNDADMAAMKGALNPQMLRQSYLRHSLSARSATTGESLCSRNEHLDEYHGDGYDDGDDDTDWSGDDDTLDAAIIDALDGDLSLAAFLIPLLHRDMRNAVRQKVDSWRIDAESDKGPEDGEGSSRGGGSGRHGGSGSFADGGSTSHSRGGHSSGHERKRRHHPSESENDRDEDDEEQGGGDYESPPTLEMRQVPLMACPFHKLNPVKYGIQHGNGSTRKNSYRACAGPGYKNIQRLKEHLKRKHTPVQCDRCYRIFTGTDKTACIKDLGVHRRREQSCQMGDPSLKEGISDEQWATLDNKSRKKNQEVHKVEKWFEIWKVLFPDADVPETPWYDDVAPMRYQTPSYESEAFAELFYTMLNHKLQMGDMGFPDCNTEEVAQRLRNLVQQTFRTYVSLHGPLSRTTDTSSSQTGTNILPASSHVGGSSTHQSFPTTNGTSQHPLTGTSRTTATALSQAQAMQMAMTAAGGGGGRPLYAATAAQAGSLYGMPGLPAGGVPMMQRRLTNGPGGGGQQILQYPSVAAASGAAAGSGLGSGMAPALTQGVVDSGSFTTLLQDDFYDQGALWTAESLPYGGGGTGGMLQGMPGYGAGGETAGFFSASMNGYMNSDGTYPAM